MTNAQKKKRSSRFIKVAPNTFIQLFSGCVTKLTFIQNKIHIMDLHQGKTIN